MKKIIITGLALIGALFIFKGYYAKPGMSVVSALLSSKESAPTESPASDNKESAENNHSLLPHAVGGELPEVYKSKVNLSKEDEAKLQVVQDIMRSKNDNDPRFNNELKNLSPSLKLALAEEYLELSAEKRNEKGTLVFLVSREIKSIEDTELLKKIYEEAPCLSMEDCKQLPTSRDPHHANTEEISLNYPQLVALFQIESQLASGNPIFQDPRMRQEIKSTLEKAMSFGVPRVKNKAQEIIEKYSL